MKMFLSLALVAIVFTACKKDEDDKPANGGRLDKMIVVADGDSTVGSFSYDANNRISEYKFESYSSGSVDSYQLVLTRDAAGRITQVSEIEPGRPPLNSYISYQGSSSQMKLMVTDYGAGEKDSITYLYTGNNIMENSFYNAGYGSYTNTGRTEYITLNGNLAGVKEYNLSNGSVDGQTTLEYDAKQPAHKRSVEEALITGIFEIGMANNLLKAESVWSSMPGLKETVTFNYSYAASGQPLTAYVMGSSGAGTMKFIYK